MKIFILCCAVMGTLVQLNAEDWKAYFDQAVSTEPTVRDGSRDRLQKTILPRLYSLDAEALNLELAQALPLFRDPREEVRTMVSGLFVLFSWMRPDGTTSLRSALPSCSIGRR